VSYEGRELTYAELLEMTQRFANVMKSLGVEKGDVVGIYMPMIPETPAAMLACARIGAPHNVVFGGFSPDAVKERMQVSDHDWQAPGAHHIYAAVMAGVTPGSIVLLHDGGGDQSDTVAALDDIISALHDAGYEFVIPAP
jgi:non-ribosomal peptide synthetase component F